MEAQERIETRKDEIRYRTADQRRMVGKFLAEKVCKKWVEDFADQETGEVISVERTTILFEGGKYIDESLAQSICFHCFIVNVTVTRRYAYRILKIIFIGRRHFMIHHDFPNLRYLRQFITASCYHKRDNASQYE